MNRGRPLAFAPRLGALLLAAVVLAAAVAFAISQYMQGQPIRGYTGVGLLAAVLALLALASTSAYSWRKRAGQEHSRGPLSAWLAWHLVFSALALVAVWLHSGAHFDGRTGSFAAVLLLITLGSGAFGLYRYLSVPAQVLADVGNLAPGTLELEIRRAQMTRDLVLSTEQNEDTAARAASLDDEIADRRDKLARQYAYHSKLRAWLWLHVPASVALAIVLAWHIAATWSTAFPSVATSPHEFESAQDCRGCHAQQFREWSGSMHAMAMQSPLTDIQNRLVLALEAEQRRPGSLEKALVGDLCVRCHAPSAYLGDPRGYEPINATVAARTAITAEGISCTTCHRMSESHSCDSAEQAAGRTFRRCEGGNGANQERQFYNANNLEFGAGRAYYGPNGASGDVAAIGNSYHRGLVSGHAGASLEQRSALCASCHTVEVHDPADGSKVLVRLQDTYAEWLQREPNNKGKIPWFDQFACADCHNARFDRSLKQIATWQSDHTCLSKRVAEIRQVMASEFEQLPMRASAEPAAGIDRPLPPRTKLNHNFAGVDIHLEPTFRAPHYPGFAGFPGFAVPTDAAIDNTRRLLQQAAAIRIESIRSGTLSVDVANLATGHKLPAGFAFARELWVEVAVSRSDDGDDFEVVIGGCPDGQPLVCADGQPLIGGQLLDKQQVGLRNFQKVLFSKKTGEVVLQNQADDVLEGAKANDAGFQDRVAAINPGDVSKLTINLGAVRDLSDVRRVRVRLRFRSLPPEFLEKMAAIADGRGLVEDATRLRGMIGQLRVFDIAQDERPLAGVSDNECN
jgi:hypothetical protein